MAAAVCLVAALNVPLFAANQWYKGNLHTHSLWSDADDYPEMIVSWYAEHGYNFLALSDHNHMLAGERWLDIKTNGGGVAFDKYLKKFGTNWVVQKEEGDSHLVRLKTLEEFRGRFESPGKFLMIPGEEISDYFNKTPIHLNASNLRDLIPPQGGKSAYEVMQNDVNAVLAQRKATGQPMIPHINHPNFRWALTAEDIMKVQGEKFLEVYNGHPITMNAGDAQHASHERIWDIVLTRRLGELHLEPIWGTAVDDSHAYHEFNMEKSNPGRGWLMVSASELSPVALIASLEKGDFYASSGVRLKQVKRGPKELVVEIEAEPGVTYRTEFIGTRKGYDTNSQPVMVEGKPINATRIYSKELGAVFTTASGTRAAYRLKGNELYVRAKVISSKKKSNPCVDGEFEQAWVQPVVPETR
jgi:hypothetical protein